MLNLLVEKLGQFLTYMMMVISVVALVLSGFFTKLQLGNLQVYHVKPGTVEVIRISGKPKTAEPGILGAIIMSPPAPDVPGFVPYDPNDYEDAESKKDRNYPLRL